MEDIKIIADEYKILYLEYKEKCEILKKEYLLLLDEYKKVNKN